MSSESAPEYRLYKLAALWGLPSASPSCVRVEAYLRLARVDVAAEECINASTSPSSQLPALEHGIDIVEGARDEDASAEAIIAYLKQQGHDLDSGLSASQRADMLAFTALVERKLEPATAYTTWCEKHSFYSHTRALYGAGLPLPLNYWLPWSQRRTALRRFCNSTGVQVYADAAAVYSALDQRLQSERGGMFFFGSKPSSLDALLFSHLSYHLGAPSAAPELRQALSERRALIAYVEHISQNIFSSQLPRAPTITTTEWAQRAEEATAPSSTREKKEVSKKDAEWSYGNKLWLTGAGVATLAYFVLSGQYITIATDWGYDEDGDDEVE